MEITASLAPTLGVAPALGRTFTDDEDRPGGPSVVLLSHALWQRRYGGDRAIVGKTIQVDGTSREVIGVMPAGFRFPHESVELWTPMAIDVAHLSTGNFNRNAVARLRPGVTIQAALGEMQPVLMRLPDDVPGLMTRRMFEQASSKGMDLLI